MGAIVSLDDGDDDDDDDDDDVSFGSNPDRNPDPGLIRIAGVPDHGCVFIAASFWHLTIQVIWIDSGIRLKIQITDRVSILSLYRAPFWLLRSMVSVYMQLLAGWRREQHARQVTAAAQQYSETK